MGRHLRTNFRRSLDSEIFAGYSQLEKKSIFVPESHNK